MKGRVYIIGPFGYKNDQTFRGGLYTACTSLAKYLESNNYKIIKLNTSHKSNKDISLYVKLFFSMKKNILFPFRILLGNKGTTMVFLSGGASYLDKLLPIIFSKLKGNKLILLPRSGSIIEDYNKPIFIRNIDFSFKLSHFVICQSNFWKTFFYNRGVSERKLKIIENWIPENIYQKSKPLKFNNQHNILNNQKTFKLVFVSRIEVSKGIVELVNAIHRAKEFINVKLEIYGDGNYKNGLLELISKLDLANQVVYKGWLDKESMLQTINKYDLAIFPSHFEGYPNTLLDFIFSKVPIISSDIPTCKAVGKDNILYFKKGDDDSLSSQIIYAHNNYSELIEMSKRAFYDKQKNHITVSGDEVLKLIEN